MTDTALTYMVAVFLSVFGVCLVACAAPRIAFAERHRECLLDIVALSAGLGCIAGGSWIIDALL